MTILFIAKITKWRSPLTFLASKPEVTLIALLKGFYTSCLNWLQLFIVLSNLFSVLNQILTNELLFRAVEAIREMSEYTIFKSCEKPISIICFISLFKLLDVRESYRLY